MKKLFQKSILLLFSTSLVLTSCNEENSEQNLNAKSKADLYLKSFYKTNYHLGKSVEGRMLNSNISDNARTIEFEDVVLEEIFIGDEERARGYIVTDKATDEFLYFVDVDRINFKLTAYDPSVNETIIKENIHLLQEWAESNKLDFVKLFEEYNQAMSTGNQERRRFWGWTEWTKVGGCDEGWQTVIRKHYILGVRDDIEYNEVRC
ncbi:MAG: hypothetical protein O9282_03810 [Flavobacterium sp.]|jgi:hypothetical protein|uniref:hypothetical protein n=2 Tax=Flavobacterium sp. TaxID=239 RepID=UPI0022C7B838|nr:hypothetical protein [Flavobacterium sp.]MCZ8330419.1 hypothetical protein [Flavobacterium sp.]